MGKYLIHYKERSIKDLTPVHCFLNMEDLGFLGIKKIRASKRHEYLKKTRHLRYISFWGKKFSEDDLVLLRRAKATEKPNKNE